MSAFERKSQPLISNKEFAIRMAVYFLFGLGFLFILLGKHDLSRTQYRA